MSHKELNVNNDCCAGGNHPSVWRRNIGILLAAVIVLVLLADQILKIWVKTHFYLGEDYAVTSWFHLKFIENNGMAFGIELWSKYLLTFGRMAAVVLLIWYLAKICRHAGLRIGFLIAVALITAGAAGNIFDCVFYGEIFNDPMPPAVAEAFPVGDGYAGWFEGRVVDMFYFPLFAFVWPDWIPVVGGQYYEFFAYIFNLADASICIGVALLILFYSRDFSLAFSLVGKARKKDSDKAVAVDEKK